MTHAHDTTLLARLGFSDPDRRNPLHDAACQYLVQESTVQKLAKILFGDPMVPTGHKSKMSDGDALEYARTWSYVRHSFELEKHICKGRGQYRSTIGFMDVCLNVVLRLTDVGWSRPPDKRLPPRGRLPATIKDLTDKSAYLEYKNDHVRVVSIGDEDIQIERECPWNREPLGSVMLSELRRWHSDYVYERQEWALYNNTTEDGNWIHIEVKAHPTTAGDVLRQLALYREYVGYGKWVLATCYPITQRDVEALNSAEVAHVQLDPVAVRSWAEGKNVESYDAPIL